MTSLVHFVRRRREYVRYSCSFYHTFQQSITNKNTTATIPIRNSNDDFHYDAIHGNDRDDRWYRPLLSTRTIVTVTKTSTSDTIMPPPLPAVTTIDDFTTSTASSPHSVHITPSCTARILQLARQKNVDPAALYLRIYVDAGGCSGFQYKFEILTKDEEPLDADDDVEFPGGGTSVVVDTASLDLLAGSTVDFVREMIRSSFAVVGNPMSESACGCGSSFAMKNFETNPAND